MRLEGKVALVSGGANGMGAEECRLFAGEGARVAIGDIREEDGLRVEAEIAEAGGEAMFVNLNVADEDSWIAAVGEVVARFGKLDVLVNNAGISGSGETDFRSTDAWDRLLDINARGVFLGTKHARSRKCRRSAAAQSSTSRPSPASWAKSRCIRATTLPRAQSGC